jgi:RNA polymerase sigma-70 factor (ECF subfamily)
MTLRPDDDAPARIAAAFREAGEVWPEVVVSEALFARYAAHAREGGRDLHARDLYLACACAAGDPRAAEALDREFLAPLSAIVVHAGFPEHVAAEVIQALRQRLLLADAGHPAAIAQYRGRSPLSVWLRVAALREAGKVRRHENVHARLRLDAPPPAATPEEEAIRRRYGKLFEQVFAEAFRALPARDRLTLRLHFAEGVNLDGLAATFGFSRATAGRRLLLARTQLRDGAMRLFGERLDASSTEVESVLKVLGSSLEVSFGALVTMA